MLRSTLVVVVLLARSAMAIDLDVLWNFGDPAASEQRFRAAMRDASGDDALLLQTQIARTYGLRGDFTQAREMLAAVQPHLATASAAVQARYYLELGRSYASATHPPESQTAAVRQLARDAYGRAIEIATAAGLDDLRVDALHMLGFVDTTPADQVNWARAALAVAEASSQPAARRWAASLHNNIGYALHEQGELAAALEEFEIALTLREQRGDAEPIRVARWMIAWTLRGMQRYDEALAMQLELEREYAALDAPSPDVYEELEALYRAKQDDARASHYAALRQQAAGARAE
jgi:tetratricopeptide (TPR) repeat protein